MLKNILNKETFANLKNELSNEELLNKVTTTFCNEYKQKTKKMKLKYWGNNICKIIDKYIELKNKDENKDLSDWELFQKILKPYTNYSNSKFNREFKKPFQEFKTKFIKPLKYIETFTTKRLNTVSGGAPKKESSEEPIVLEVEISKKDTIDNKTNSKKDICPCENYIISNSDEKPYLINENDDIISILEPGHTKSQCGPQAITGDFQLCPNFQRERECILISGPSGSGKTYFAKQFLRKYKKIYPKNKIVLISNKPFEDFKIPYTKLPLDENTINNLKVNDYKNSIIVFDDVENITSDKKLQERVIKFLEEVLNVGRSLNIWIIVISHILMNYRFSRNMIMECNKVVMFPNSGVRFQYQNFLNKYLGLSKKQINNILNTKSRWLAIDKECPITSMNKKEMKIIL